jgi:hypothetical protein
MVMNAYFGESGHLFRFQSGHLSERSDAGCESMVKWPFWVKARG